VQDTFGKYRLMQRLAFGGMAEVFLARVQGEAGFTKTVVIKRLHPRLSEDHEFTRMLIDEARITSQLVHTNICQVLDLGQVDGSYFIAMEYVPGEDLRTVQDHYRRQRLHMPAQVAVHIVTELLAGLDYAHRKEDADGHSLGVIHRDISPQNVLISYEGEVKIIDFGIAKARQRLVQTQAGVIKGKFRYMSPEQAIGGKVDHRTDLFAAGVVLYELLRGEPHSLNVSDTEVLRRMRDAEFEPLKRSPKEVPADLQRVVRRALHKSPRKRFQTAGAFRQELVKLMPALPVVFGDRSSPLGREELALLMKQIFPAERRRKRSGDSSQRRPRAKQAAPAPRKADHPTSGMATVDPEASEEAEIEAAIVAASGRLPRESTDHMIDDHDVEDDPVADAKPAPVAAEGAGAQKAPASGAAAEPSAERSDVSTRVGEPSREALEQDAAATRLRRVDVPAESATVARPRAASAPPPDLAPDDALQSGAQPSQTAPPVRPGRQGGAGAFSRKPPAPVEVRKQLSHGNPSSPGVAAHEELAGSTRGEAMDGRQAEAIPDPWADEPENATIAATEIPQPSRAGRSATSAVLPASHPPGRGLRWFSVALLIATLGVAAFYVGRYGLPDWLARPASAPTAEHDTSDNAGADEAVPPEQADVRYLDESDADSTVGEMGDIEVLPEPGDAGHGRVRIESKPSGASVEICGKRLNRTTPVSLKMRAGKRCRVRLALRGHRPFTKRIEARSGKTLVLRAKLRRAAAARRGNRRSSAKLGHLLITSIRKGHVFINGQEMGRTPKLELSLPPGQYAVWVRFPSLGAQSGTRTVYIKAGQSQRLHFAPTM
jgi:serine/threonine protein kinase